MSKPSYDQHEDVLAHIAIENRSGHDCAKPSPASLMWCDGGSTCISASEFVLNATDAPAELWPAGQSLSGDEVWQLSRPDSM